MAREIHAQSRGSEAFVPVNCSALPEPVEYNAIEFAFVVCGDAWNTTAETVVGNVMSLAVSPGHQTVRELLTLPTATAMTYSSYSRPHQQTP